MMRRAAWLVLGVAAAVACGPKARGPAGPGPRRAAEPLTPRQIAERATPSIVLIELAGGGVGTGFLVAGDGRIVTNFHVIAGQSQARVKLADGRELEALEVMAVDPAHDLAIIRVGEAGLPPLPLGDSSSVRAGDRVIAIGHPLGLGTTISDGLVSAVREVDPTLTVLQITAPISPGSSGGPLFNDRGEVIGVTVGYLANGQNLNIGMPANYLAPMLESRAEPVAFADFGRMSTPPAPPPGRARQRHVPVHEVALLDDCPEEQIVLIGRAILGAIQVGAPLYNEGRHKECYLIYSGTADELVKKVPGCAGVKKALSDGMGTAAGLADYTDQAWAMRDAFDGLLDVIERKLRALDAGQR